MRRRLGHDEQNDAAVGLDWFREVWLNFRGRGVYPKASLAPNDALGRAKRRFYGRPVRTDLCPKSVRSLASECLRSVHCYMGLLADRPTQQMGATRSCRKHDMVAW